MFVFCNLFLHFLAACLNLWTWSLVCNTAVVWSLVNFPQEQSSSKTPFNKSCEAETVFCRRWGSRKVRLIWDWKSDSKTRWFEQRPDKRMLRKSRSLCSEVEKSRQVFFKKHIFPKTFNAEIKVIWVMNLWKFLGTG